MNRTQLEHIIRAASQISGDSEIVVIGSQAIHATDAKLPPLAFLTQEADVYPRNRPELADDIYGAIANFLCSTRPMAIMPRVLRRKPPFSLKDGPARPRGKSRRVPQKE